MHCLIVPGGIGNDACGVYVSLKTQLVFCILYSFFAPCIRSCIAITASDASHAKPVRRVTIDPRVLYLNMVRWRVVDSLNSESGATEV